MYCLGDQKLKMHQQVFLTIHGQLRSALLAEHLRGGVAAQDFGDWVHQIKTANQIKAATFHKQANVKDV